MTRTTASSIHPRQRRHEGEVNGRWVIEADACPFGTHPAGTLVCDPSNEGDDLTFTAKNFKRYGDTATTSCWTPREQP